MPTSGGLAGWNSAPAPAEPERKGIVATGRGRARPTRALFALGRERKAEVDALRKIALYLPLGYRARSG